MTGTSDSDLRLRTDNDVYDEEEEEDYDEEDVYYHNPGNCGVY